MSDSDAGPGPGSGQGSGNLIANVLSFLLFCLAGAMVLFCLLFILPKFHEIFRSLDVALPLPTQLVLALGRAVQTYWFLVLPAAGLLSVVPLALAHRRAWLIYLVATVLALIFAFGGMVSVVLPIMKIQQMLTKK